MKLLISYMMRSLEIFTSIVFLFGPPIFFYLNYKLKLRWKISIFVTWFESVFGVWLLRLLYLFIASYVHGQGIKCWLPDGPALVFFIFLGWIITGFVFLLWSPIIAIAAYIIFVRNRRREQKLLNLQAVTT